LYREYCNLDLEDKKLPEKSRAQRFDEVFQMILIVVALSFDILWLADRIPVAEIAVFIWVLTFWAYGNLKGGIWEYPLKIGSFNLSITLRTNFYMVGVFSDIAIQNLPAVFLTLIALPAVCIIISVVLTTYLKDSIDRKMALEILISGTLGHVISMTAVVFLG
jgi:hypothetical protein